MIKNDFPSKWTQFINQIHTCLSTDNINAWESALLVFYTLVQHYEYKLNYLKSAKTKIFIRNLDTKKWKIELQWMM
jgi:hypothetical protein